MSDGPHRSGRRARRRWRALRAALAALLLAGAAPRPPAAAPAAGSSESPWIVVDYGQLVDRRRPSHSGESVGRLIERLDGRPLPRGDERPADRHLHGLLDPLVEPYAFVMIDALDSLAPVRGHPFVEVGGLWLAGSPQPAWVELLRARRYVVESDGTGRLRVLVPWTGDLEGREEIRSVEAAREAWDAAWPVLRHVLAAERRRLLPAAGQAPPLSVEVHAFRHHPERSAFLLGVEPLVLEVSDTRPAGRRPPLDLAALRGFLDSGWRLEGGRLDDDGSLRLLGSQTSTAPGLLGRPLRPEDLAVAYRAVFHGGLAEPYMSLDRGFHPQTLLVNYGGRLRDTALGLVSLQCDVRFKTFSIGLDIVQGRDRRGEIRPLLPEFRTHLEALAADPRSEGLSAQQTRLWFYPDAVELTLSAAGDVMVLERVRMSAASERVAGDAAGGAPSAVPPWTSATVAAINRDYDGLARLFPELADLDQVVSLLAFFTWLREADAGGRLLPDLDALLALELPEVPTPREFPQLLTFNLLPGPGSSSGVLVVDRVRYAAALDRLHSPSGVPLDARRGYSRAVEALIPEEPEHAALLAELRGLSLDGLDDPAIDDLSFRAERIGMLARTSVDHYRRLLNGLPAAVREQVGARVQRGETLRPTMLGIGGLDLGMGQVLRRAQRRSREAAEASAPARTAAAREPEEAWRRDPDGLPPLALPDHGADRAVEDGPAVREFGGHRIEIGAPRRGRPTEVLVVLGADGPEVRSRRLTLDSAGRGQTFERVEGTRALRFRFERQGERLVARLEKPAAERAADAQPGGPLPDGLALLHLTASPADGPDPPSLAVRMERQLPTGRRSVDGELARRSLQRLILGPEADPTPELPIPGIQPLEPPLAGAATLMILAGPARWRAPWDGAQAPGPGEEDPDVLARAFNERWSRAAQPRSAVVGVDAGRSPGRWAEAPAPAGGGAVLVLPADGFPPGTALRREDLERAWGSPVVDDPARVGDAKLVVLLSAEAPARFAARLRSLAASPAMHGRLLAAWSLSGPVRADLPASLLQPGHLAGLGLGGSSLVDVRRAREALAELAAALLAAPPEARVETLAPAFVWYF